MVDLEENGHDTNSRHRPWFDLGFPQLLNAYAVANTKASDIPLGFRFCPGRYDRLPGSSHTSDTCRVRLGVFRTVLER